MPRNGRTKLVHPEDHSRKTIKDSSPTEQSEEPMLTELDNEIECPRCHESMELQSSFNKLTYWCEACSFVLKSV